MSAYKRDREWSEQFIPSIKRIVGPRLLVAADHRRDTRQATDLLIFTARDMRIAARVRRPGYAEKYPWQFTIRSKRDTETRTELAKVCAGFGDWMFYGHADKSEHDLERWFLIDLHEWRFWREKRLAGFQDPTRCGTGRNSDGTYFAWYDLSSLPRNHCRMVLGASHPVPFRYGTRPTVTGSIGDHR
jgi:hypothetical protein